MRIVFMGTPAFAVPTLMEIVGQGHEVAAVYTQPPRPAGRGMAERRSAVHVAADALGLDVRHPERLREEAGAIAALEPDVLVVVAYGLILPQAVLDAAPLGAFNVHASLLPRWRGAAPISRAIMAGDAETGVAVMKMEAGLDTGPVAMEERVAIAADDTAGDLTERLARLGGDLMARALGGLARGALGFTPQREEGVTYARKIDKAEARIDWTLPAEAVRNHIHGLSPSPGAWAEFSVGDKPERLKILRARIVSEGRAAGAADRTTMPAAPDDRLAALGAGANVAAGPDSASDAAPADPQSRTFPSAAPTPAAINQASPDGLSVAVTSPAGPSGVGLDDTSASIVRADPPSGTPPDALSFAGRAPDTPGKVLDDALAVACGDGAIRLLRVQRAGKGDVDAGSFLNGTRVVAGDRFEA